MQSPDFMRRMERVLSARVEAVKAREAKPRRLASVFSVLGGTLVCFILLKAAALAHGTEHFRATAAAEAGLGAQVYLWIAGPDPISTALATAMRGGSDPSRAAATL
ncbi:hypothetical protein [Pararhodobacter marinus]|uniref:Uncharacterized protein n=1 Tax=Pararhodobacter marinus TaxID=2184063 RepID=A0A2U2C5V3_9RHOB|nr:hypothetical protein [Pararhodobacter marinus]PWE27260.1 hypothetical protein C4N9_18335 [Pararhodobacter marinus]